METERQIRNFAEQSAVQGATDELTLLRVLEKVTVPLRWVDPVWQPNPYPVAPSFCPSCIGERIREAKERKPVSGDKCT